MATSPAWDRLFGTFRLRDDPRTIRFGLEGLDRDADQSLAGLIRTPFTAAGSAADIRLGRYALFVVVGAILAAVMRFLIIRKAFATDWSMIKDQISKEFPQ
ncbi:MAG: hypothetical protein KatS3mg104_2794 [Phycisphaerae bacterium]|jgi:hypothetical protein|nr:MAG: hypothetical protein KatS3mg104_2794 [Phycisphaerae bacterium]